MISCRTATVDDISLMLDWAADEGWNPGIDDADAFLSADPEGFFVARDGTAPVAAISVVNHSPDFAFLGLYIVQPSYRGRGVGLALWHHAIAHAGTRTIGLDGVPDQQANYARSGFAHAGGTQRFAGHIAPARTEETARLATPADIPHLVAMEAAASGWAKPRYLAEWVRQTGYRRTLVLERADRIAGFVTVRQCRDGAKIGPLVAANRGDADLLLRQAAQQFAQPVMIDVPDASEPLAQLCRAHGLTPVFGTARMYRGQAPAPAGAFFAVVSLELG